MADIVLATLNARYQHASFGLRYLLANLGELQSRAVLREFTIQQQPLEIVEALLQDNPRIIGLGIYIWNVTESERVVCLLKRLRPDVVIILGGPEVSYETAEQAIVHQADLVLPGEADQTFAAACRRLLGSQTDQPATSAFALPLTDPGHRDTGEPLLPAIADLNSIALPYDLYTDDDLQHRVVYVEASRGCPFTCEFCLSALEIPVRQVPLEKFLASMQQLLDRGCQTFKFVDRTFNLNLRASRAILEFFLERYRPGLFLHYEMIPDRLPDPLRELIVQFPAGTLQFEVGIQSWNLEVADLISRRQDNRLAAENLQWLRSYTGVHIHADLIAGLPGEDLESFAAGFDRLVALQPHEIQVGILKRLRGTPIIRHDDAWDMRYSPAPPYELLCNRLLNFETMQGLRRFAKTWDLLANSGNFVETAPRFWSTQQDSQHAGPFAAVWEFSEWLYGVAGRTHSLALTRLLEFVFRYLTEVQRQPAESVATPLLRDYRRGGRSDIPPCLRPWVQTNTVQSTTARTNEAPALNSLPMRQARWQEALSSDAPAN